MAETDTLKKLYIALKKAEAKISQLETAHRAVPTALKNIGKS